MESIDTPRQRLHNPCTRCACESTPAPPEPPIHRAARQGDHAELLRLLAGGAAPDERADLKRGHIEGLAYEDPATIKARHEEALAEASEAVCLLEAAAEERQERRRQA